MQCVLQMQMTRFCSYILDRKTIYFTFHFTLYKMMPKSLSCSFFLFSGKTYFLFSKILVINLNSATIFIWTLTVKCYRWMNHSHLKSRNGRLRFDHFLKLFILSYHHFFLFKQKIVSNFYLVFMHESCRKFMLKLSVHRATAKKFYPPAFHSILHLFRQNCIS